MMWEGKFEEKQDLWLRWCDRQQHPIPTGKELAEQEKQRADQEKQRADQLAEQLRALGINPDELP
jgi:hypothetical protein